MESSSVIKLVWYSPCCRSQGIMVFPDKGQAKKWAQRVGLHDFHLMQKVHGQWKRVGEE